MSFYICKYKKTTPLWIMFLIWLTALMRTTYLRWMDCDLKVELVVERTVCLKQTASYSYCHSHISSGCFVVVLCVFFVDGGMSSYRCLYDVNQSFFLCRMWTLPMCTKPVICLKMSSNAGHQSVWLIILIWQYCLLECYTTVTVNVCAYIAFSLYLMKNWWSVRYFH